MILTMDQVNAHRSDWDGKQTVFTNGVFDIIHWGHVSYLQKARDLGDLLILGLNTDASVQRLKGPKRPIVPERERALVLDHLQMVDVVIFFDQDTPLELIRLIQPTILVKGADYTVDTVVGADDVIAHGGRVELIQFEDGLSSSSIIERILERYGN